MTCLIYIAHEPNHGCYGYFYYWLHWRLWIQWSWRLWMDTDYRYRYFLLSLASEKSWHHFSNSLINFNQKLLAGQRLCYLCLNTMQCSCIKTICKTTVWLNWTYIYGCVYVAEKRYWRLIAGWPSKFLIALVHRAGKTNHWYLYLPWY